jgi:hypothetical protein
MGLRTWFSRNITKTGAFTYKVLKFDQEDITAVRKAEAEYRKEFAHDEEKLRLDKDILERLERVNRELVQMERQAEIVMQLNARAGSVFGRYQVMQALGKTKLMDEEQLKLTAQRAKNELAYIRNVIEKARKITKLEEKSDINVGRWIADSQARINKVEQVLGMEINSELKTLKRR